MKCCFCLSAACSSLNAWIKQCIYLYINYHHALPKHFKLKITLLVLPSAKCFVVSTNRANDHSLAKHDTWTQVGWLHFFFFCRRIFCHLAILRRHTCWFGQTPSTSSTKGFYVFFFVNFKLVKLTGRLDHFKGTTQWAFQTRVDLIFPIAEPWSQPTYAMKQSRERLTW